MSTRPTDRTARTPLIALVHKANRALQADMVREGNRRGFPEAKVSHNTIFATLGYEGSRISELAEKAGITKQSMGEIVRDMVDLGILELQPDPTDGRAKLVTYSAHGRTMVGWGNSYIAELEQRFEELFGKETYDEVHRILAEVTQVLESD